MKPPLESLFRPEQLSWNTILPLTSRRRSGAACETDQASSLLPHHGPPGPGNAGVNTGTPTCFVTLSCRFESERQKFVVELHQRDVTPLRVRVAHSLAKDSIIPLTTVSWGIKPSPA